MSYVSPIKIGYEAEPEEGWTDKIGKYLAGEVDNLVLQSCVKVGCHVDKDELEKALRYDRDQYVKGYEDGKRDAAAAIEALQAELEKKRTADCWGCKCEKLEPKRGEWIEENRRPRSSQFVCSECHRTAYDPQPTRDKAYRKRCRYAYCPNCGAKMTEVQDG